MKPTLPILLVSLALTACAADKKISATDAAVDAPAAAAVEAPATNVGVAQAPAEPAASAPSAPAPTPAPAPAAAAAPTRAPAASAPAVTAPASAAAPAPTAPAAAPAAVSTANLAAGQKAFEQGCFSCHDQATILASGGRSRADWEDVVAMMQDRGFSGSPNEVRLIVDYLSTAHPAKN